MNDEREFESLLHDALGRKGAPAPFAVDVADAVMARVAELGPAQRVEMGLRQFMRWAGAAAALGAGLSAAALRNGPSLENMLASFGHAVAGTTGTALKLSAPASSLAGSLGRVGAAVAASIQTVVQPLAAFQPFAHALLAAVAVAMLGISTYVVARDVSRRAPHKELS
jgi:hypothetical protein